MIQYLLLIQGNTQTRPTPQEWERFFTAAQESGLFRGGSAIGDRIIVGDIQTAQSTAHVAGYMRFEAEDRQLILDLLKLHPVVLHGGSVELCELPKS